MEDREIEALNTDCVDNKGKSPDDKEPNDNNKQITRQELIDQLESQVAYFEQLPQHQRFSFTTNADVYYFMMIILNILKMDRNTDEL